MVDSTSTDVADGDPFDSVVMKRLKRVAGTMVVVLIGVGNDRCLAALSVC